MQSSPALRLKTTLESRYGNRESFLRLFNPNHQHELCNSEDDCFFGDYPSLFCLGVGYGDNAPVMWLIPQLYNLSEFCGCREKLQGAPLEECARLISMEFSFLKVSELMLFFHRFKAGLYGRFYGSIDPLLLMTALRSFLRDRAYAIDRKEQEEREHQREEERKRSISWNEYCRIKHAENEQNASKAHFPAF